jgi:hypothetical protein
MVTGSHHNFALCQNRDRRLDMAETRFSSAVANELLLFG